MYTRRRHGRWPGRLRARADGAGLYRFHDLEPGSALTLELFLGGLPLGEPTTVEVLPLDPGGRYVVPQASLACAAGAATESGA